MADGNPSPLKLKTVLLVCVLATLVNIAPLILFDIGGDILFHLVAIDCFGRQFWQGDLFPRWCMNANAGLGAPIALFYFPLPFYVTTLFYPLTHMGVDVYRIYTIGIGLATLVSFLTCYHWLKDFVSPERALLVAVLFLFMPYRMEAMFFRSAYAEVWGMAWLPLLFLYVRRVAKGDNSALVPLAATFALLFVTHVPCAMVGIIFSGVYMLIMTGKAWEPKWRYALAGLWGAALATFYVLPAEYYRQFITPKNLERNAHNWVNNFLRLENITELGQVRPVISIFLGLMSLLALSFYAMHHRSRVGDAFARRELGAWISMFALAFFLLFPISAPFYALLGPLSEIVFPWRMQSVFVLSTVFLLAASMQWFTAERRMKTWKADYSMLLVLLVLFSYFLLSIRDSEKIPMDTIMGSDEAALMEYRSRWTDKDHFSEEYMLTRYDNRKNIQAAKTISGTGTVTVEKWAWDGIVLNTQSTAGMTVRLNHAYFPVWSAALESGQALPLRPEMGTGQMLLDIPVGWHHITLRYSVATANPPLIWFADIASILAALLWLWRMRRGIILTKP